ncbi:MAG: pitrilysin family protein [Bacteroidota bacterium]
MYYRKTVLDNGIRIVSEKIPHVRSISLGIWADVGSRDENANLNGISHFLEHMVFKGTKKRNVREIAQSLESLGGYLNAFTTKEQTCFYARVLDSNIAEAMDVLSDLMLHPTFKKEELEKEKLVVIEELRNSMDDPEDIIHDYFEKALFPKHSLGYPIIGTEDNLRRFRRDDLRSHIATHYIPSRIVVSAAGNVEHDHLVSLVRKHFRSLKLNGAVTHKRLPGPVNRRKSSRLEYPRPIKQAHICLGTISYGIQHKDRYPLLILNALLGEGMSSRLYQSIREKRGMAYSVYSFVSMLSDTGVFGTYIGTDKKNIDRAIDLVFTELEKAKRKLVSKAELERTKSQIKGTMMLGLENTSGRMIRLGSGEIYFESHVSLDTILKRVDAVTPDGIARAAKDIFKEEAFTTVVVRPS